MFEKTTKWIQTTWLRHDLIGWSTRRTGARKDAQKERDAIQQQIDDAHVAIVRYQRLIERLEERKNALDPIHQEMIDTYTQEVESLFNQLRRAEESK